MSAMTTGNSLENIPAIILAGGLGTRLRSVVADRPKVLAEVAGKPFLYFLLKELHGFGIKNVVISTGYMAEKIEAEFGKNFLAMNLQYSQEYEQLGTGGAIRLAAEKISEEQFFVLNGDSFCETNFCSFAEFHEKKNSDFSIVLTSVPDVSRFGQVQTDDEEKIIRFDEKGAANGEGWINAGIYLAKRKIFETIPPNTNVSLEKEIFPQLIGKNFFAFKGGKKFIDIGTPESYSLAEKFFSEK